MSDPKHDVIPQASTLPARVVMHPMVERMLAMNPTPEALEKLLNLQREWEKGEAKRAYTRALVEMRQDLPAWIKRDKTVEYLKVKYTHASLAAALEAVLPALNKHGFNLSWTPAITAEKVAVTATLTHRDGHSEGATLSAPADMSGNKSAAQGVASTVTLLQRYTALAILGIATADMVEPQGQAAAPAPEKIDTARNMRAMAALAKAGKSREAVEQYVGKPVGEWTLADLDKLRAWDAPSGKEAPSAHTPVAPIGEKEVAVLKAILKEFTLEPAAFADLIEGELGRRPESLAKIEKTEVPAIIKAFDHLRKGEWSVKHGHFDKPPVYEKEVPEDSTIPF